MVNQQKSSTTYHVECVYSVVNIEILSEAADLLSSAINENLVTYYLCPIAFLLPFSYYINAVNFVASFTITLWCFLIQDLLLRVAYPSGVSLSKHRVSRSDAEVLCAPIRKYDTVLYPSRFGNLV